MMNFLKRMLVNVKILIIALIIAIGVFIVVKNPDLFKASVLLMQDRQTMIDNKRDIGYKNSNHILDVFIAEDLKNFDNIVFSVTYDSVNVIPDLTKIESQLAYQISNQNSDGFSIIITSNTGLDYGQSLFTIPFSGDNPYILLSDGTATLKDGGITPLAIGNLDEVKTLHKD